MPARYGYASGRSEADKMSLFRTRRLFLQVMVTEIGLNTTVTRVESNGRIPTVSKTEAETAPTEAK